MVHERLESRWSVAETEEHDGRFKETKRGDECSFPLVFFTNADVVKSPSDVELSKYRGVFHVIDQFGDEGQGICVANSVGVQVSVVLARAKRTIFFCNKEEGSGLWGLGRNDSSSFKVFIDKCLTCLLLLWVKRVDLGNLWNERRFEVNGVVIGLVGRKNIVGGFRKYILEIRTPVGNFLIWSFRCLGEFGGQRDLIEVFAIEILLREVLTKRRIILRGISLGEEQREFHVRITPKPSEQVSLRGQVVIAVRGGSFRERKSVTFPVDVGVYGM